MTSNQIINDVLPRTQLISTSNQTVFNTNWTANVASDVVVFARPSNIPANDASQLVSSSDYNVTFIGSYQTVRVTFTNPRILGDIITIIRNTPSDRLNLYTNTNFTPSMLNQDFGILTLTDQQNTLINSELTPRYNYSCSFTDPNNLAIDLILPILGANQFWVKDNSNTGFVPATINNATLPASGPFILYEADGSLPNAINLGLLSNGFLAQTVSGGSATPYIIDIPVTVDLGGTGLDSMIPYSVILGGVTNQGALQQVASVGTLGQVLTSNGASQKPTFQTLSAISRVGEMILWSMPTPPSYALVMDGSAVSRITYAALFAIIGTYYGPGDGLTTFNLPSYIDFVPAGSGGSLFGGAVGSIGGANSVVLLDVNMPVNVPNSGVNPIVNHLESNSGAAGYAPAATSSTWNGGSATPISIVQQTKLALMCIIFQ